MTQQKVTTSRFGEIEIDQQDVIRFPEGVVGLPAMKEFVLIQHKDNSPFRWMQSLDDGTLAFLVIDPQHYTSYAPEMPSNAIVALDLTNETPILVYTICNIPKGDPQGMTLNLAGPIVINGMTRTARQVILEDDSYPVRYAVFAENKEQAA